MGLESEKKWDQISLACWSVVAGSGHVPGLTTSSQTLENGCHVSFEEAFLFKKPDCESRVAKTCRRAYSVCDQRDHDEPGTRIRPLRLRLDLKQQTPFSSNSSLYRIYRSPLSYQRDPTVLIQNAA